MRVAELTGQDLAYWVDRANDPGDGNRLRRDYGYGTPQHDPVDEPGMRSFVARQFGDELLPRSTWQ